MDEGPPRGDLVAARRATAPLAHRVGHCGRSTRLALRLLLTHPFGVCPPGGLGRLRAGKAEKRKSKRCQVPFGHWACPLCHIWAEGPKALFIAHIRETVVHWL